MYNKPIHSSGPHSLSGSARADPKHDFRNGFPYISTGIGWAVFWKRLLFRLLSQHLVLLFLSL